MRRLRTLLLTAVVGYACNVASGSAPDGLAGRVAALKVPPGFEVAVFAEGVDNARSMARGDRGTIFVGNRAGDRVWAVVDADGDSFGERKIVVADGLDMPNGVAFRDGALFVAENRRILRFDDVEDRLARPPAPTVVLDGLPGSRHHGWRYLGFGPDGRLYVSIGAPCNVCDREAEDPRFATIARLDPDGGRFEVFARGVRNSVGFTWRPGTDELWFTDNGRDRLGDDLPPDELNRAAKPGLHFGFPFCHGGFLADPEFGARRDCEQFEPPVQRLGAHVASLGVRFYTGTMFPPDYRGQVLIAEHGSWNRTIPDGYRVSRVRLEGDRAVEYTPFVSGFLVGSEAWGRPVDLLELPDGSVLVSDDLVGAIYRISYRPPAGG